VRIWADAEYLLWWNKERFVPALATTSPVGTAQAVAGRLGLPTTSVLYGDGLIGGDAQSGYRGSLGFWLDHGQTIGLGARFFYMGDENDGFTASSNGNPILARPFFNADPLVLAEDALLVAFPGISTGTINIVATNVAKGGDLYLRKLLLSGYCNRLDLIGGYQHTELDDAVWVGHSLVSQDPGGAVPVGTLIDSQDRFKTENQFDGGFIGLMTEAEDGRLTWRMLTKIAFGNMKQSYSVSGSTATTVPGGPAAGANNGLLTWPTNIGFADRNTFAIVPELNVSVGYKLTRNVQLTTGYSFIYWSKVVLAGDIIDTTINPTQLPGPLVGAARPTVSLFDDDFWYHGISAGVNVRF